MSFRHLLIGAALIAGGACGGGPGGGDTGIDAARVDLDAAAPDASAPADAPAPADASAPASGCLAGCAQFNNGSSGCGVSNYDCDALCAESGRIGSATGCEAETTTFWDCFAAAPAGASCTADGACRPELAALDACVARAPSTDCLRACALCGDTAYGTCALGCARRDAHAHVMGCDATYQAYYACRLAGPDCPTCIPETNAFTGCWMEHCRADPDGCPVTP